MPFRLNHPIWVEDPHLDLDYHIRRHVLPAPGGPRELTDLTGAIVGVPLDRARPLWEIHVVEGLHDGNVALIGKIHHAAVDGVSGAELFVHLFDLTPHPPDETAAVAAGRDLPPAGRAHPQRHRAGGPRPAVPGPADDVAARPGRAHGPHRDATSSAGTATPRPSSAPCRCSAPRTPWSAAITPHRSVAFARVRLSDIKRVRAAFGVKVNDVVLALVSGALRRYLRRPVDAAPAEPLVGMCPVSVRTEDEQRPPRQPGLGHVRAPAHRHRRRRRAAAGHRRSATKGAKAGPQRRRGQVHPELGRARRPQHVRRWPPACTRG